MYLDDKRLLIAGGAGLAGSGVLRAVLASQARVRVRVPVRGPGGAVVDDPRVEYVTADLTSPADCARVAAGCDAAVMAAAHTGGAAVARRRPWHQVSDNVVMDVRMLEAFHAAGVRRVVYVSTSTVYQELEGPMAEAALDLNRPPPPAYLGVGWAKRYGEQLCAFWHAQGLEILIARLANVYGPYARFDPAASHFVAGLVRKAVDRLDPFVVWGSPAVARDILFVDDFGRAVLAMLEATSISFEVLNIGSGRATTVGDVVGWALKAAQHQPIQVVYDQTAPTTAPHRVLDCTKARSVLGWEPQVSPPEGVRRTVAWWQENRERWKR